MASAIDSDQGTVSKLYKGRGTVTIAMAELAWQQFGVPRGWLLFNEGEPWAEVRKAYEDGRRDAMGEAASLLSRLAASLPDPATLAKLLDLASGGEGR